MDITCPSCAEPWDTVHLLEDAIFECNLPEDVCARFDGQLDDTYRIALANEGWTFAGSHVNSFTTCPCCKNNKVLHDAPLRIETRTWLADLMGNDIDGFASFSEDIDRMQNARLPRSSLTALAVA